MDIETNRKFFDLKHRKKVRTLYRIGAPISIIGVLMVGIGSMAFIYPLMLGGVAVLVVGVPVLAVASSWKVKEADILTIMDRERKQFKENSEDKLNFPGDLAANALMMVGCEASRQGGHDLPAKKLKSGAVVAPVMTCTYLYIKRDRVVVFSHHYSIVEDYKADETTEIRFSEFTKVEVVPADNGDCKGYSFRFLNGNDVVFSAPLQLDDYTIDSFAQTIMHTKERVNRR